MVGGNTRPIAREATLRESCETACFWRLRGGAKAEYAYRFYPSIARNHASAPGEKWRLTTPGTEPVTPVPAPKSSPSSLSHVPLQEHAVSRVKLDCQADFDAVRNAEEPVIELLINA
jgi:hypothetical protein